MSFLQRLSFKSEKQLAIQLVQQLVKSLPPATVRDKLHTLSANRITRVLERVLAQLTEVPQVGRGLLGRAVLANQFRWALKDAGYSPEFIDVAVEALVVETLRRQRAASGGATLR